MIVVHNIFHLKFGKAKEGIALWREGLKMLEKSGFKASRILADVTGTYYTLIHESEFSSLSDFEKQHQSAQGQAEWQKWYEKFVPLVESGRREIYRVVE